MEVYLAWDGDRLGQRVGRASLMDDEEGLREISQSIDRANLEFKTWVELSRGEIIASGGDEGRAKIPADKLDELPAMREKYAQIVGTSVSVGLGTRLSESDQALLVAKLRGGDTVVFFTDEVQEEIQEAQKQYEEQTKLDKIGGQYLSKSDRRLGMHRGVGSGFEGKHHPIRPAKPRPPKPEGSEHSAGEVMRGIAEQAPAVEMTHAAKDFEEQFHEFALAEESKEKGDSQRGEDHSAVKEQVASVLKKLKEQAPLLAQLKQAAPEVYQSIMAMAQSVIVMARSLDGGEDQSFQKSESPAPQEAQSRLAAIREAISAHLESPLAKGFGHLPMPYAASRHHVILPPGSQKDSSPGGTRDVGKRKVVAADGKHKWRQMRAGVAMDPETGESISTRLV